MTQIWIICLSLSPGLISCASRSVAIGDWGHPVDLNLHNESLKGLKINVKCARANQEKGQLTPRDYPLCRGLRQRFESMGAMTSSDDSQSDFSVLYIDRGGAAPDENGMMTIAYMLTGFVVPYVASQTLHSELQIFDHRGILLDRQPLAILETSAVGWGALPAQIRQSTRSSEKNNLSENFYRFAENRLASYASQTLRKDREGKL